MLKQIYRSANRAIRPFDFSLPRKVGGQTSSKNWAQRWSISPTIRNIALTIRDACNPVSVASTLSVITSSVFPISFQNNQGINMTHKSDCIFCQIVGKQTKAWVIWESPTHMAFLSIYPNMRGVTVVIPKDHKSSYAFDLEDQKLAALILAAKEVAKILDSKLEGVGRTALVLEGFGVDHVHAKLYPLPNTAHLVGSWQSIKSNHKQYFDDYLGYICSNDSHRATEEELERVANLILGKSKHGN